MKFKSSLYAIVAVVTFAGAAHASVTVKFIDPDKYGDMPFAASDKKDVMDDLQKHFEKLGAALPAGQDLKIDVLDIDLAGRVEPGTRAMRDLRIMRGSADWPVIKLRYSLESNGKVLKSGDEHVADQNYMMGFNHYNSGESLRYEKQMLDRWFKKTLAH
ncbi:MAG: DUF3016 domain-containing protein [Betaproteobacteria bacterium]